MSKLYVVATPIGNLEDITLRALRILKEVDIIACEDSRVTKKLLNKYDIDTKTTSYYQHSSSKKVDHLINLLKSGNTMALVTDAGTPGIQDPGNGLVEVARDEGIEIIPISGASAVATALSVAGINADEFYFAGFLPKKKGRQTLFKYLNTIKVPVIIYESPHRIIRTLNDINKYLEGRGVIVMRELTKKFEEIKEGNVLELIEYFESKKPKGEFVLIIKA